MRREKGEIVGDLPFDLLFSHGEAWKQLGRPKFAVPVHAHAPISYRPFGAPPKLGLSFAADGNFIGKMTPIVLEVSAVPETST